ncbi:MAG: ABC transporter substrate-binding protein [Alphaproteobacteria bacterium]|nr:ABC transporter substrate-binding protein [Alphaproteobacteria bacterium]
MNYYSKKIIIIAIILGFYMMRADAVQALTITNCGMKVNYPTPLDRNIAFHGTAMYEILAVLNLHNQTTAMSGINRDSLQYNVWRSARSGKRNLTKFQLNQEALNHIDDINLLDIRYPNLADFTKQKSKFYLAGYYQGIYPNNAQTFRKALHNKNIYSFINTVSCQSFADNNHKIIFEDLFNDMLAIGDLTNRKAQAAKLIKQYQARLNVVSKAVQKAKNRKKVFYFAGGLKTPYGPHTASMESAIIAKAGATNITADNLQINWRNLRRANPDTIIIPFDGNQDLLLYRQKIIQENFSGTKAVNNIIPIFYSDWQTSPAAVDAVEHLARALYPELF